MPWTELDFSQLAKAMLWESGLDMRNKISFTQAIALMADFAKIAVAANTPDKLDQP